MARIAVGITITIVAAELAVAWIQFQRSTERGSSLVWAASRFKEVVEIRMASRRAAEHLGQVAPGEYERAVFLSLGAAVLAECKEIYEREFREFLAITRDRGSRPILMYIPSDQFSHDAGRAYFRGLSGKYGVTFVDLTGRFTAAAREDVFLAPVDVHPSAVGHRMIAEELAPAIDAIGQHRAHPAKRPVDPAMWNTIRLGDLPPALDQIMTTNPEYPYRMRTNRHGLRMDTEIPNDPREQTVLLIGDSFTAGTAVPVEHTYATALQEKLSGRLVLNAGVGGYGLADEMPVYDRISSYLRSDVVVLQVLDNDLSAYLWFKQAERPGIRQQRSPTAAELDLAHTLADVLERARAATSPDPE